MRQALPFRLRVSYSILLLKKASHATIKIVKKEALEHALKMLVTDMKGHFQEKVPGNKGNFMTISSVDGTVL